ncbi:hypothetical protein V501_02291 [Pseudogymnoascus sp. VKM F-4519 (FW-2642)]|nr:hypothetical protein V501_02291 [Pseudogymnoascus sp. VKM F-4519 (FW-2642)]
MQHEPSRQSKQILHIKDHFNKYTQLYPLKCKNAEPIADAFALFIAAFLPPKIMHADNGKEFKGALLILHRKYGIQVINGAPRSPQTQGLVEQANGVVEAKLRAWKMDNGSTEWADGLLEVTLAMNRQKYSTIGCVPAELLFRERTLYTGWLSSQAQKDLTIGVPQEDAMQAPVYSMPASPVDEWFQLELELEDRAQNESHIDSQLRSQCHNLRENSQLRESQLRESQLRRSQRQIEHRSKHQSESESEHDSESEHTDADRESEHDSDLETITVQPADPIIQNAQKCTQKARALMARKYTKRNDTQHFDTGYIVTLKVPQEDRTLTDNRRLFARILGEPYSHRYKVITVSGIIKRLIPTKQLGAVVRSLWADTVIPDSEQEVTLGQAARDASTSSRVGVSCQCKGSCDTKRCRCYKENKQCSVHCHRDDHDCGNLSGLATRTELALVEKV